MAAIKNVCPALSALRPSRKPKCRAIATVWARTSALPARMLTRQLLATLPARNLPVARSLTPTRWMGHQRRQAACPRTTRCRTSCGRLNPAAGAVCGGMTGFVRHCGSHDPYGQAAGQSPPPSPSQLRRLHHCWYWPAVLLPAPWLWGKHIVYRRLRVPYTYVIGSIRRCRQSTSLLRPVVHHAHRMM